MPQFFFCFLIVIDHKQSFFVSFVLDILCLLECIQYSLVFNCFDRIAFGIIEIKYAAFYLS